MSSADERSVLVTTFICSHESGTDIHTRVCSDVREAAKFALLETWGKHGHSIRRSEAIEEVLEKVSDAHTHVTEGEFGFEQALVDMAIDHCMDRGCLIPVLDRHGDLRADVWSSVDLFPELDLWKECSIGTRVEIHNLMEAYEYLKKIVDVTPEMSDAALHMHVDKQLSTVITMDYVDNMPKEDIPGEPMTYRLVGKAGYLAIPSGFTYDPAPFFPFSVSSYL